MIEGYILHPLTFLIGIANHGFTEDNPYFNEYGHNREIEVFLLFFCITYSWEE